MPPHHDTTGDTMTSRNFHYFLVEGGETLRLCKEHIAKVNDVHATNVSIVAQHELEAARAAA